MQHPHFEHSKSFFFPSSFYKRTVGGGKEIERRDSLNENGKSTSVPISTNRAGEKVNLLIFIISFFFLLSFLP